MESNIWTVWLYSDFNYNNQSVFGLNHSNTLGTLNETICFGHLTMSSRSHRIKSTLINIISVNRRRKIIAMFSSISHLQIKRSSWSMLRSFSQIDLNASIAEYLCQDLSPKIHLIFDNKNQDGGTWCIIWWTPSLFDDRITDKLALSLKTCQTVSFYQTCICK